MPPSLFLQKCLAITEVILEKRKKAFIRPSRPLLFKLNLEEIYEEISHHYIRLPNEQKRQ